MAILVTTNFFTIKRLVRASSHTGLFTVVVDAGHGGIDGGVSGINSKVKESDLNLDIAKKLEQKLFAAGVRVVMTRTSYGGLYGTTAPGFKRRDMQKRAKIINSAKASALVSIHLNYYSQSSRRGATTFYNPKSQQSERLADVIQGQLNQLSGQTREFSPLKGDYYLLNVADCPSVICECGFLSNAEDEKLLLDENYREEIANRIYLGVLSFLCSSDFPK